MSAIELKKSFEEARNDIIKLEQVMMAMPERRIHIEPKHYFAPGIYMREIFIPKGVTLTGKIHKTEHMCVLSQGKVRVWNGDGTKTLIASSVVPSSPGVKRAIHAIEDSVWINVHHNPENIRDLEQIEKYYVSNSLPEFLEFTEQNKLEGVK